MSTEAAMGDLTNDILWASLDEKGLARDALLEARKMAEHTLAQISLTEQELGLQLQLGKVTPDYAAARTLETISKRRGTLKFVRLLDSRQSKIVQRHRNELQSAIHIHKSATLQDELEPSSFDTDLWETISYLAA